MNMSEILKYLTRLCENNNREWYHAHKAEYKAANAEFDNPEQFLTHATEIFRLMKPFNDYLNKALTGFQMTKR